jgi:hypothetical protein
MFTAFLSFLDDTARDEAREQDENLVAAVLRQGPPAIAGITEIVSQSQRRLDWDGYPEGAQKGSPPPVRWRVPG